MSTTKRSFHSDTLPNGSLKQNLKVAVADRFSEAIGLNNLGITLVRTDNKMAITILSSPELKEATGHSTACINGTIEEGKLTEKKEFFPQSHPLQTTFSSVGK